MALKGDRSVEGTATDISFFMSQVAERGGIVTLVAGGSGVAMDQAPATVQYATTSSGLLPIGLLLADVENLDQTRQHTNWHKTTVQYGGKVPLATQGTFTTNMTSGTMTSCAGQPAYLAPYGRLSQSIQGNLNQPKVGQFLSNPDENGFVKVRVQIPN